MTFFLLQIDKMLCRLLIQLSPENIESEGGVYLLKVCYKKAHFSRGRRLAAGGLIIGGIRVEHDTPLNGPVAIGRIAAEY